MNEDNYFLLWKQFSNGFLLQNIKLPQTVLTFVLDKRWWCKNNFWILPRNCNKYFLWTLSTKIYTFLKDTGGGDNSNGEQGVLNMKKFFSFTRGKLSKGTSSNSCSTPYPVHWCGFFIHLQPCVFCLVFKWD